MIVELDSDRLQELVQRLLNPLRSHLEDDEEFLVLTALATVTATMLVTYRPEMLGFFNAILRRSIDMLEKDPTAPKLYPSKLN